VEDNENAMAMTRRRMATTVLMTTAVARLHDEDCTVMMGQQSGWLPPIQGNSQLMVTVWGGGEE
jgi:hypothetical protein